LLPSGKFPRFAFLSALLAALFLVVDLTLVRSAGTKLLVSNALDFVVVLLAAACTFYVARRSSGYPRQLWFLLATAFALESLGQGITTYYESFVPSATALPTPSDIFFFLWAAPVFMIFLPPSDEDHIGFDSLRLLDFLQVAIVALTAYLYYFYSPAAWLAEPANVLRNIFILYVARDLILSLAFFFRSRATVSSWLRSFSMLLGFVFLACVVSDVDYLFTLDVSVDRATWGHLIWMFPLFIVILFAGKWKQPETGAVPYSSSRVGDRVVTQVLPIAIPVLVIFMAHAIAREQLLLAWIAVSASVVCASARLILTNRRQRRISANLLAAEKALRQSEQLLSTAFRSSPDAFSIGPFPDGPYITVNDAFTRITGYTREETVNRTPTQMNLWVDPAQRKKIFDVLNDIGEVRDVEFQFRTKAGRIRTGQMYASLFDLDGRRCSLIVVRDITPRKEAEEILRSSEERFRSLVRNLHVGIITYNAQLDVTYANQATLDLIGLPIHQVIGKTARELHLNPLDEVGNPIPDELRPAALAIASRKPILGRLYGWRLPNRSDTIWTFLDAVPEFDSSGELTRVFISFTDVTEQRRATEALRKSEERFRSLVENLHVGIIIYDPDVRVLFANQAIQAAFSNKYEQFLGRTTDELGLITLYEDGSVMPPEERPVPVVLATKQTVRGQVVGVRARNSTDVIWTLLDAIPEFSGSGEISRIIVSVTDITQQRRATEALRKSEERFRSLIRDLQFAVVLHDPETRIEFANRAAYRMFNFPEGTMIGKLNTELGISFVNAEGKDIPLSARPVLEAQRARAPIHDVVVGFRRRGHDDILWAYGSVIPEFDADGKLIRTISSFADITELKNAERAIRQLSNQLLTLQDEERRRIGRELHDGLAQTVLAINLSLAQVRQSLHAADRAASRSLEKARELTQQMSREIRTLSYLLHPPLLDDLGLLSALKEYVHGFSERSGIETQLLLEMNFDRLPQHLEIALFRVVQESLANVQRHSGSATAEIRLRQEASQLILEISDSGHGFTLPTNGAPHPSGSRFGVGIPGMRERIAQIGGHLDITSGPNGTTVRATMSLPDASHSEPDDASSSHPDRR